MHPVQATFRNGRLELAQPIDWPDGTRAEVIPLISASRSSEETMSTGWPADYFAETAGALAGEAFEQGDQGKLPIREIW